MSRSIAFDRPARRPARLAFVAALMLSLAVSIAPAAARAANGPSGSCNDVPERPHVCRIDLAPGIAIEAGRHAVLPHADGGGYDVVGTVEIPTGSDPIVLAQADMSFRRSGGKAVLVHATGLLPFPQIGFLESIEIERQPLVSFGVRRGDELAFTSAPLQPDRDYFYFHGDGMLAAGYGPISMATPGGALSVVLDPTDPYFYVAGELSGLGGGDSNNGAGDSGGDGSNRNARAEANSDAGSDARDAAREGNDSSAADPEAVEQEPTTEEGGDIPEMGVAFSLNGLAPFAPLQTYGVEEQLPEFDGHLYLRGPIPINQALTLNGETVIDIDPDLDGDHPFEPTFYQPGEVPDLAIGGNGTLSVGIPFLTFFEYGFEVGNGTAVGFLGRSEQRAVFSGEIALDQSSFLGDLPVGIHAGGRVAVYGVFDADLFESFIHAEGELGLDPSAIGEAFGVELGPIASGEAQLHISALGLSVHGSARQSPFPGLGFAEAGASAFISRDGLDSYFAIQGDLVFQGVGLHDAEFKAHVSDGVTVSGGLIIGTTDFAMKGRVSPTGTLLEGSVELGNPIELNAQKSVALADELLRHEANRDAIRASLEVTSGVLEASRWTVDIARKAFDVARVPVEKLESSIAYHEKHASKNYGRYKKAKRKKCRWYQVGCKIKRAARKVTYYARYVYHKALEKSLYGPRKAADAVLTAARNELVKAEGQLAAAKSGFDQLNARLDDIAVEIRRAKEQLDGLPDLEGEILPIVTARVENGRVSARVVGYYNGAKLTEGRVQLESPAEACLDIPSRGEVCVPL